MDFKVILGSSVSSQTKAFVKAALVRNTAKELRTKVIDMWISDKSIKVDVDFKAFASIEPLSVAQLSHDQGVHIPHFLLKKPKEDMPTPWFLKEQVL